MKREWTSTSQDGEKSVGEVRLKLAHWNILAQKLADNFKHMRDGCPALAFENRLRLMEQHLTVLGADVIGMSEIDGVGGDQPQANIALVKMMKKLGYDYQFFEKPNNLSGSGVFFKKDKLSLVSSRYDAFAVGASQGYVQCVFALKEKPELQFVFVETHLKAKPANIAERVRSAKVMVEDFTAHHQEKPVFVAGDFNEVPGEEPIEIMEQMFEDLFSVKEQKPKQYPKFTTHKFREKEGWVTRTIDYIFVANNEFRKANNVTVSKFMDPE